MPKSSSTPKSEHNASQIVAEGEARTIIREKEERCEKAMSIYENVDQKDYDGRKESSMIWYEYGCV